MRVVLIDDDEAVLHSLQMLLDSRGLEVLTYGSAEAFLSEPPGDIACVVADVRLPGLSGIELQRELKHRQAALPVILITGHGDIPMAVAAVKEGAFDFIEKPFDDEQLVRAIAAAAAHASSQTIADQERAEIAARLRELSPRQREVMDLVVQGLASKQIAARLGISPRTVESYRAWVMERMEAHNIADLVRKVLLAERS